MSPVYAVSTTRPYSMEGAPAGEWEPPAAKHGGNKALSHRFPPTISFSHVSD
jgi:hypothetical protein